MVPPLCVPAQHIKFLSKFIYYNIMVSKICHSSYTKWIVSKCITNDVVNMSYSYIIVKIPVTYVTKMKLCNIQSDKIIL